MKDCHCIFNTDTNAIEAFCSRHIEAIHGFVEPIKKKLRDAERINSSLRALADEAAIGRIKIIGLDQQVLKQQIALAQTRDGLGLVIEVIERALGEVKDGERAEEKK